ncbi:phosphate/phosphite/phosphonate ABC transporter substrate-binding protein [Seleniivibrio woodruffii]|uniref:Phosphonate transport system substrate-binding protein n=1 Tax=Seleniivibrio woodruffii TaxID=1078050 RepID=A0A4R1K3E0_9BACT|nr:phosphate/phosphite/phosphonate ABC transporter substrate-binding protein [Seleniivibrio woodruffii]TCK58410.1 phosphonate transport system substrate-binding protein [Seleniivibrio woodruffii]TVZ36783.1 phosphonate transport system substrate-binding protein [Seleniivibrio woodruffii]
MKSLYRIFLIAFAVMFCSGISWSASGSAVVKPTVYFSAITLYHPIVMYQKYQPMMDYLTRNTSYKFELKLNKDYRKVIEYLANKEVNLVLLGGTTYVKARETTPVIPILKPKNSKGEVFYRSTIVVRKNSPINSIDQLCCKSIVFPSELSTSGFLVPVYNLMKKHIYLNELRSYKNLRYHDSVAREVQKGNYDAGALIDAVAYQYSHEGLKVIWRSEPIPGLPIVVREDADPKFINEVKAALLKLDYSKPADRKIMSTWDEELKFGFAEAKDSDYNTIRGMIKEMEQNGIILH